VVIFVASISFLLRGIQIVYLIPYITVLCLTAYGSYRYSNNTLKFWKSTEGSIYVKGGFILYLIVNSSNNIGFHFHTSRVFLCEWCSATSYNKRYHNSLACRYTRWFTSNVWCRPACR